MGSDLFIIYTCPFRREADTSQLHHLLRLRRHLSEIEAGRSPATALRIAVHDGEGRREQVFTHADLKMAAAKLAEIYPVCEGCPANFKKAFGIRGTIGCQAFLTRPLDDFAERILHETLVENARAERRETEQSNLVRALLASTPGAGQRWREAIAEHHPESVSLQPDSWGSRPVTYVLDGVEYWVTVHALLEMLFMFPDFPPRAVEDVLSFFRSFFAVVGGYVSTPDGKLDQRLNERFWRKSPALNELNLYIQLLKHGTRLGQGVYIDVD